MDVDKTGLLRIRDDQKHTAEVEEATAGDGCSPVGEPSTADPLFSWMKMALDFWSKHLLLLLATGNPRMWPRNPWQPPIQGLRMSSSSGAETAVSREILIMRERSPLIDERGSMFTERDQMRRVCTMISKLLDVLFYSHSFLCLVYFSLKKIKKNPNVIMKMGL